MRNIFEYNDSFIKYDEVKSVLLYGNTERCPNPLISVIMPVYGNPKFFRHSYLSVINQQADFQYEIIIIDNTPIDENKSEILKVLEAEQPDNVYYYRNEKNIGMIGNWNRGITLCRAPVFTYCHDDDMLFPDCILTLLRLKDRYPGKFIIPSCRIIDERIVYPLIDDRKKKEKSECTNFGKIDIFMGNPTNGVGCLFYKEHMIALGGYDEEYYPSHDNAVHIKLIFKYGASYYWRQLYCYRITNNNESNNVYKDFILNGLFYCNCMIKHMGVLSFFKFPLIHAFNTNITMAMAKTWARESATTVKPTIIDKIIYRLLHFRNILKVRGLL